jgi:hypothetical protein
MGINDSNKLPYLLAAGAIGGAVGYLFLTESGQRVRQSIFNAESGSAIPDKIEEARTYVERRGKQAGDCLKSFVDRVKESVDEGRRVYERGSVDFQHRMDVMDRNGAEVVANVHHAIDRFNQTIHNVEASLLEPMYQAGAMAKAVDTGVRRLLHRDAPEVVERPTFTDSDALDPYFSERQRIIG